MERTWRKTKRTEKTEDELIKLLPAWRKTKRTEKTERERISPLRRRREREKRERREKGKDPASCLRTGTACAGGLLRQSEETGRCL